MKALIFLKEEDDSNFISYMLDKINYKIFTCHKLFTSFDSLKNNIAFYYALNVSFIIIVFNFIFYFYILSKIKRIIFKEFPTPNKLRVDTEKEILRQQKENKISTLLEPTSKKKKKRSNKSVNNIFNNEAYMKELKTLNDLQNDNKEEENYDYNELTFEIAKFKDKRNIFSIFISICFGKFELINIFFTKYNLHLILIAQYLTLFTINIFFNTLLYSDEVISNKYHNNGKLDYITSLLITIVSNILTSIISYYLNYSKGIEERIGLLNNIKKEAFFIINFLKIIKCLKIKFIIIFICEIIILFGCFYYIILFFIVYSFCKINLIINYITSMAEDFIKALSFSIIIAIFRKMGLLLLNKYLYNISKYLDENF